MSALHMDIRTQQDDGISSFSLSLSTSVATAHLVF